MNKKNLVLIVMGVLVTSIILILGTQYFASKGFTLFKDKDNKKVVKKDKDIKQEETPTDDNKGDGVIDVALDPTLLEKTTKCTVDDQKVVNALNTYLKKTKSYEYGLVDLFTTSTWNGNDAGTMCISDNYDYIYIKKDDVAYGYNEHDDQAYTTPDSFDEAIFFGAAKEIVAQDRDNELQLKYPMANFGNYGSFDKAKELYYLEIKEYNGEFKLGGKLYAQYTIDLKTRKYTRVDY